jgi:hypothetical protein
MDATADVFGILFAQLMFFWIYKKYYQKLQLITVNGRKLL